MSEEEEMLLREMSALVMGNRYRAELMLALVEAGERGVCLGDLALVRQVQASVYVGPVRALIQAGLVERVEPAARERRRWFRRCGGDALWRAAGEFLVRLPEPASRRGVV